MVKQYKGAYSGEHGDGLVRSEWIAPFFGPRLTAGARRDQVLARPARADEPRQDRRALEDGRPRAVPLQAGLRDEGAGAGARLVASGAGCDKAVEMCNNNGHCRKFDAGTMCPSYRATRDESPPDARPRQHAAPRLSGQLGRRGRPAGREEALDLCVSCKGCKRECPTGVDMARMKIEFLRAVAQAARLDAARARHRLPAALCAVGGAVCAACEPAGSRRLADALGFTRRRPLAGLAARLLRRAAMDRDAAGARWCCWSIPSTAISSRRTRAPRCACWRPPATACTSRNRATARGRCAAAGPILSAGLVDEARARRGACSTPWRRGSRAAFRSSGSSRRACYTLRDEFAVLLPGTRGARRSMRSCSRNSWRARRTPAACT